MGSTFQDFWFQVTQAPQQTWQWFNTLSREEWMVVLVVVCGAGFLCLLGFQRRI